VSGVVATVFGSTGFLGRYVVNQLGRSGTQVVVAWRGDELENRHLKPMGDLGQIVPMEWEMRYEPSIYAAVKHSDVVINLTGKHYETRNYSFEDVHVEGAARLARIAAESGVEQFIHVSACGANAESSSKWLRTKAASEAAVREHMPNAVIIRPTVMFGHEDRLLRRVSHIMQRLGWFPMVGSGEQRLQPVFVNDVAYVIGAAVRDPIGFSGKVFELGGPHVMTVRELVDFINDKTKQYAKLYQFPEPVAKLFATATGTRLAALNPAPMHVVDDVIREVEEANVVSDAPDVVTFRDLEIAPVDIHSELGSEALQMYRKGGDRSSLFSMGSEEP